jgi:hypothetical protein
MLYDTEEEFYILWSNSFEFSNFKKADSCPALPRYSSPLRKRRFISMILTAYHWALSLVSRNLSTSDFLFLQVSSNITLQSTLRSSKCSLLLKLTPEILKITLKTKFIEQ